MENVETTKRNKQWKSTKEKFKDEEVRAYC